MTIFDHIQWLFVVTISTTSLTAWAQPSAPMDFMATNMGSATLDFTWTAVTGMNVTSYTLTATSPGEATVTDTFTGESTSSGTLSGLVQFTAYSVDLVATDNAVASSTATTVIAATLLSAPTSLQATTVGSTSIALSWTAPSGSGVLRYRVFVSPPGGSSAQRLPTGASTTLTGLDQFTTYTVTVRAVDTMSRNGDLSSPFPVTTILAAPTAIRGTPQTSSTASLSWTAPSNTGVQSYSVTITPVGGGTPMTATPSGTTASFSGLSQFTTYNVAVVAVSATTGNGEMGTGSFTTLLAAPGSFRLTARTSTSITLSWSAPNSGTGVQSYSISVDGGTAMPVGSGTSHTLMSLTPNTQYSLTIRAVDNMGSRNGDQSSISVTTRLSAPTSVATTPAITSIQVTVTPPSGGISGYRVTVNGGAPTTEIAAFTISALMPATLYTITIAAIASGTGLVGDSAPFFATTNPAVLPSSPTSLIGTASDSSVTLTWQPPVTIGDVSVKYIVTFQGAQVAKTTSMLTIIISSLLPNTFYTFTVSANNTAGMSGPATFTISTLDLPSAVSSVTAEPVSTTSVRFSWTAAGPPPAPGVVDGYQLTVVTLGENMNTTAPPVNAAANLLQTTISSLVAGTPYFVELRVSETVRGLGVPRASVILFSAELDADPTATVSTPVFNAQSTTLTWAPVHLFQARHFFNYTIEYVPASGGTQKRHSAIPNVLVYSACTSTQCSLAVTGLDRNFNYTATVGISRSTNRGVTISIPSVYQCQQEQCVVGQDTTTQGIIIGTTFTVVNVLILLLSITLLVIGIVLIVKCRKRPEAIANSPVTFNNEFKDAEPKVQIYDEIDESANISHTAKQSGAYQDLDINKMDKSSNYSSPMVT